MARKPIANVLVIDDEPAVCESVKKILSRKGLSVHQALCVTEGLNEMESGVHYDLVVLDLMMPQVSGVEFLKIVAERWPELAVVIITGYSSIASAVETTRLGALGYLPKPFTPDELVAVVDRAMAEEEPQLPEIAEAPFEGKIDVDLPFDAREVEGMTSSSYVDRLTRSDVPLVSSDYCIVGQRPCKKYVRKGMCEDEECPILVAERKKAAREGATMGLRIAGAIDIDMPFSAREVAAATSEEYVAALGRSDMPVVCRWAADPSAWGARRVLVVDDEAVVVNSIRKCLTRKGYVVDEALTGKNALDLILSESYDLVLLDMRMPDASGLELLQKIKEYRPTVPVLIVTGYASIDTAVEAIRLGASDYMAKPFTPDELCVMTERVLARTVAA